jgi:hypothetical protein
MQRPSDGIPVAFQDSVDRCTVVSRPNLEKWSMTKFEIVWRNPEPVKHTTRRRSLESGSNHLLYVLQEFVDDGNLGYWTNVSDLEVLVGGFVA